MLHNDIYGGGKRSKDALEKQNAAYYRRHGKFWFDRIEASISLFIHQIKRASYYIERSCNDSFFDES